MEGWAIAAWKAENLAAAKAISRTPIPPRGSLDPQGITVDEAGGIGRGTPSNGGRVKPTGEEQIIYRVRQWEPPLTAAGYPDLLFHDLRRSAVRNMRKAGMDSKNADADQWT